MATLAIWHGTEAEADRLRIALSNNCACTFGELGVRVSTCSVHQMMVEDQRALDHLLFVRRIAAQIKEEEFKP
jgi:hypothetical protein